MVAVPFDPRDVRVADAVLSTHDHDDHCHGETLRPFADNTGALFIGPASSAAKMRSFGLLDTRIVSARHGDSFRFSDITVEAVEILDHSDPTSVGWLVSVDDGPTLFDGGDGMYGDYFKKVAKTHRVSAATLSVAGLTGDGRKIYMDARELVAAAEDLGVDLLIPKHWDLWRNVWLDPWEVVIAAQVARAPFRVHIPRLGEVIKL